MLRFVDKVRREIHLCLEDRQWREVWNSLPDSARKEAAPGSGPFLAGFFTMMIGDYVISRIVSHSTTHWTVACWQAACLAAGYKKTDDMPPMGTSISVGTWDILHFQVRQDLEKILVSQGIEKILANGDKPAAPESFELPGDRAIHKFFTERQNIKILGPEELLTPEDFDFEKLIPVAVTDPAPAESMQVSVESPASAAIPWTESDQPF